MSTLKAALKRQRFRNRSLRRPLTWYRHRGLSESDVFLATFPRSGTTWTRFMLYEIFTGEQADFRALMKGIPYIGQQEDAPRWLKGGGRILQTHEPFCDRDRKVLYMVRDPRSVVVSQFYWLKRRNQVDGEIAEFVPEWLKGRLMPWGTWSDHVNYWLDSEPARSERLHLIRYEEMKAEPKDQIEGILRFLEADVEPGRIDRAIENNTLERMKEKEDDAPRMKKAARPEFRFVRSGSTTGWRKELPEESQRLVIEACRGAMQRLGYATEA